MTAVEVRREAEDIGRDLATLAETLADLDRRADRLAADIEAVLNPTKINRRHSWRRFWKAGA